MYKNIIVVPDDKNPASLYNDNIIYILWFAKQETSFFDKNKIREPHIWKNVEWGKREKIILKVEKIQVMFGYQLKTMEKEKLQSI